MVHVYEDQALTNAVEEEEAKETQNGCGVCNGCGGFCGWIDRNRVIGILIFAFIGGAIGIGLSFWEPEDAEAKEMTIQWLGLVGDMFIRALKCFVLPLVFVNVVVSIVDMSSVGKAGSVAWYVIIVYLVCTVIAACFGVIGTLIFKNKYEFEEFEAPGPAYIQLGCNEPGYLLAEGEDGSVSCTANYTSDDTNVNFIINDVSKTFQTVAQGPVELSFSDSVYLGIFAKTITDNIILSFSEGNFIAIIVFAIVFGIALSRVVIKAKGGGSFLFHVFKELDVCFQMILFWIIFVSLLGVAMVAAYASAWSWHKTGKPLSRTDHSYSLVFFLCLPNVSRSLRHSQSAL
jgi:Na+/H+-dicarboxylate symporter